MAHPWGPLRYVYVGTADVERDLEFYTEVLGARKVWDFRAFGARVAAVRLCDGPLFLLADHRPAPSAMPIIEVGDLEATARELRGRGWKPLGGAFEVPDGPCYRFDDPSGNPYAILQPTRPRVLEGEYRGEGAGRPRGRHPRPGKPRRGGKKK